MTGSAVIVLAAVAGGLATWWAVGAAPRLDRLHPAALRVRRRARPWPWAASACLAAGVSGVVWPRAAMACAGLMVAVTGAWHVWGRVERRAAVRRMTEAVRVVRVMESLLSLGHVPSVAIQYTADECPLVGPVASAVALGSDPWDVLEHVARLPGAAALARLGQAWQVSALSGAGMRESLETIRAGVEADADTATLVMGELAAPRATSHLLVALPLVGLGAAVALGVDVVGFFSSRIGATCLMSGILLACVGFVWSEHIGRSAEPTWTAAGVGR